VKGRVVIIIFVPLLVGIVGFVVVIVLIKIKIKRVGINEGNLLLLEKSN
jgi:hypothetical protein